jgi:hypothetical protein
MNRNSHHLATLSSPKRIISVPLAGPRGIRLGTATSQPSPVQEAGDPGLLAGRVRRRGLAQTAVARVACGVAAAALTVLTVALLVIAPARTRPASVEVESVRSDASAPVFAPSVKHGSALGIYFCRVWPFSDPRRESPSSS